MEYIISCSLHSPVRYLRWYQEGFPHRRFAELFANVYGFSPGIEGLCYIGLGLGFMVATVIGASIADKMYLTVRLSFFSPYSGEG
jgi:hypothetical protein